MGGAAFMIVSYRVLILRHLEATPLTFMMIFFGLAGLQFILMGLLAEIIVRIYYESQSKPIYRIRELVNISAPADSR